MDTNALLKNLNWRYATKKFDKTRVAPEDVINTLLESMRLSPSSLGVQPWKFLVIENKDVRVKLREAAHGQPQFTDASHLVIFCRREDVNEKYINEHVAEMSKIRNVSIDSLVGYKNMVMNFLAKLSPIAYETWTSKQLYIALGFLLTSAAHIGLDACPMEGFDAAKVDEILGLEAKNLRSTVACALGYRSADDAYAVLPKSRFPMEKVVEWYR